MLKGRKEERNVHDYSVFEIMGDNIRLRNWGEWWKNVGGYAFFQ